MYSKKIQLAFDKAARTYDKHSLLQQHVGSTLISLLRPIDSAINIFDLGCGTGNTTLLLAQKYRYHLFEAIDLSPLSIQIASQKLSPMNIKCYQGNFESQQGKTSYFNLIFSNMALQWCQDLTNTFYLTTHQLKRNGILAISLPLTNSLAELEDHYSIYQLPHEQEIRNIIYQSELLFIEEKILDYQLVFSSRYEALQSLKKTGAFASNKPAKQQSHGKANLLEQKISTLSYRIGYFILGKHA